MTEQQILDRAIELNDEIDAIYDEIDAIEIAQKVGYMVEEGFIEIEDDGEEYIFTHAEGITWER